MSKDKSLNRQAFLLTFFDKEPKYQEKKVNGFWLIKQFNGDTKNWQVAVFTEESFKSYKKIQQNFKI